MLIYHLFDFFHPPTSRILQNFRNERADEYHLAALSYHMVSLRLFVIQFQISNQLEINGKFYGFRLQQFALFL
jgi:hypothetical protein